MFCKFDSVKDAIDDIRQGKMVVVVDDENRENEGDVVMAANAASGEKINFMAKYARGLICVPVESSVMKRLNINQMVDKNTEYFGTKFGISIDASDTTTGISAYDRAKTIRKLADRNSKSIDFVRPGHIFPLKAEENGVLKRSGHTEATVDLVRLAGFDPACGVCCEIMKDDGHMARLPELIKFKNIHDLKIITIKSLIEYRKNTEKIVKREAEANLPTKHGFFKIIGYRNMITEKEHVAIVKGNVSGNEPVLARIHSKCLTGDVFDSLRCDCGDQLLKSLESIEKEGRGVVIYMDQEGRGIGIINKIRAYRLQEKGMDTVEANNALGFPADLRDYWEAAQIFKDLAVKRVKLMTNNPQKVSNMIKYGIEVTQRVPINTIHSKYNECYLKTKKDKMGQFINC